uniref:CSON010480 protein n=1 Tax=Culicoides sonorensis TaxID=179676 RepID=A0A336N3Z0_CULSO
MVRNKSTIRKFNENYVSFGYTYYINDQGHQVPMCLICNEERSISSMTPAKLKVHFEKHVKKNENPSDEELQQMHKENIQNNNNQNNSEDEKTKKFANYFSYLCSYTITKASLNYQVGEKFLKPLLIQSMQKLKDLKIDLEKVDISQLIQSIPLSRNTIMNRTKDIASDLHQQTMEDLKNSKIGHAFQSDASTDIQNQEQLVAFARYEVNGGLRNEILFLKPVGVYANAESTFNTISEFYAENDLDIDKLFDNTTDACPVNVGAKTGVNARIQQTQTQTKQARNNHCDLHKFAIATKIMTPKIKKTLEDSLKIINLIKNSALNSRLLEAKAKANRLKHTNLLYHSGVRWNSIGNSQLRLSELQAEVEDLIYERTLERNSKKAKEMYNIIKEPDFFIYISYMGDLFTMLNKTCNKMQGDCVNKFDTYDAIETCLENLRKIIIPNKKQIDTTYFPSLSEINLTNSHHTEFHQHRSRPQC